MTSLAALSDELEALVARASRAVVGVEQGRGAGTGVVVAQDGYLLTNHHVAGSGRSLRVRLPDGEAVRGELVGSDPPTDLAVVRVQGMALTHLPLARSARVGQLAPQSTSTTPTKSIAPVATTTLPVASPSPIASATPSPTPSVTPTPSPVPTPTPSIDPTPTPTPTVP